MTVQIKPLKGFKNSLNHELNTLSLLVKSNYNLQEYLSNAKEKILISLNCIMDYYKSGQEIYFYHKIQVPQGYKKEYLKSKRYKSSLNSLKVDLNDSLESLISFVPSKFDSHFINIIIVMDNETIELSADEFSKLNWIIRSKLTKINNEDLHFVDKDNEGPFEKIPINMNNKVSLFIDDNDEGQFEKTPININDKVSLFIDDNDDDPFEKAIINARDIDLRLKRNIKITNKKFIKLKNMW